MIKTNFIVYRQMLSEHSANYRSSLQAILQPAKRPDLSKNAGDKNHLAKIVFVIFSLTQQFASQSFHTITTTKKPHKTHQHNTDTLWFV
jgi:hypothetical protein